MWENTNSLFYSLKYHNTKKPFIRLTFTIMETYEHDAQICKHSRMSWFWETCVKRYLTWIPWLQENVWQLHWYHPNVSMKGPSYFPNNYENIRFLILLRLLVFKQFLIWSISKVERTKQQGGSINSHWNRFNLYECAFFGTDDEWYPHKILLIYIQIVSEQLKDSKLKKLAGQ